MMLSMGKDSSSQALAWIVVAVALAVLLWGEAQMVRDGVGVRALEHAGLGTCCLGVVALGAWAWVWACVYGYVW